MKGDPRAEEIFRTSMALLGRRGGGCGVGNVVGNLPHLKPPMKRTSLTGGFFVMGEFL